MTFLVISVLIALVVYQMTKDMILSSILGIVLIAVNVVLYIVKSSLYEGLIQKLLDLLSIANHYDSFVGGILDVSGIIYMLSVICIFVFLTIQCIQNTALELNLERRCRYESAKKEFSFKKLKEKINIKNIISNIKEKRLENKKVLRHGSYSIGVMAIVIAIVVVLNLVIQELPSSFREIDLSSEKLYTIGDQTKELLDDLDKDVDLYYIAQDGTESTDIQRLVERYEERSEHIKVEQKDPAVYPTFTQQYTSDSVSNNSIIVVCGDKSRVVNYSDMYETSINYQTYIQETTAFDGEGQLTSAINYVISDDMPVLYTLEGHNEASMGTAMTETIQKANIEIQSLNLLTQESVPEDASCLFIFAPSTDLSEDEANKIIEYLETAVRR